MKKILFSSMVIAVSLFATDYSSMSIDELSSLRGSVPKQDRDAFKAAMQSKMQTLSPEERSSYKGIGNGQGQMLRDGSGSGGMYKGSKVRGFGSGGGRR